MGTGHFCGDFSLEFSKTHEKYLSSNLGIQINLKQIIVKLDKTKKIFSAARATHLHENNSRLTGDFSTASMQVRKKLLT